MDKPVKIQESGEMYLETILILTQKKGSVRSLDVAEYMGFSKPSVSRAMGLLKSGGYMESSVKHSGFMSSAYILRHISTVWALSR